VLLASIAALSACKASTKASSGEAPNQVLPSYAAVASKYNERIDLLQSVWARGVVSVTFTNQRGKRQNEQGNCYLMVTRPSNISFTIHKLGEQYFRLGCNDREFWAMDMQEKTARIGEHTDGGAHIDQFGLPIVPQDLLSVFALAPLPAPDGHERVGWTHEGSLLVVSHTTLFGKTRYLIDPVTYLPERAELIDADTGQVAVRAEFANPLRTRVPGMGGFFPQVPGQIDIHDLVNETKIKVTFGSPRGDKDIDPDNFNLHHLLDVLGPFTIERR
jgi:hypothetical protein